MPFRRSTVALFMSTVGMCASTGAGAESFGFTLSLTQPSQANLNPAATQTLTFNQFNAALGTLTGVQFTLSSQSSVSAGIEATNFSAGEGGSASGSVNASFDVVGPGVTSLFSGTGSATASCWTSESACSMTSSGTPPTFATSYTFTGPDLSAFVGNATFDVLVSLSVLGTLLECNSTVGVGGICTASGNASWSGDLVVEFLHRPNGQIPEPGSVALLGLAAAALALRRRKVDAQSSA